jgi:hypothetical protein
MISQFGDTQLNNDQAAFRSQLRLADGPLELSWHHCGTTAEFVAEIYARRCRVNNGDYNDARHSISYLMNELLENAVKFRAAGDIIIEAAFEEKRFEVKVVNLVETTTSERFQALLAEMVDQDPGELLIARIEANAEDANSSGSGLGLLTLMSDYGAKLGWIFSGTDGKEPVRLETVAALELA